MKIIFLSGFFMPEQRPYVEGNSFGVIQNAADALQLAYLKGLSSILPNDVLALNLPFVGSYPKRFRRVFFPGLSERNFGGARVLGVGFLNLSGVKLLWRALAVSKNLISALGSLEWRNEKKVILVYSAHLPFVIPAFLIGRLFAAKICVIVPDLPEFMSGSGGKISFFKRIDRALFNFFIKKVEYSVLLTRHMMARLGLEDGRSVVIEGISNDSLGVQGYEEYGQTKSILYTGTLDPRYGVLKLLDAFLAIENPNVELWICGAGGADRQVENAAARDGRIKFFGQIGREDAVAMQRKATFLINPRSSEGEFTKYSFPSKVIEYFSSGRPVIMYRLDGIPSEYYSYCFSPAGFEVSDLSDCIERCISMPLKDLNERGALARDFVLTKKNPAVQVGKLINLISKDDDDR
ncbi:MULTISPECIES: glycosyltransferase family 4 protein [unclassified Variovorax]|uniref:glycosyltransferase family 4 protein n=1 Tax=unclassified Variovorax TaxID=663243 RepID=UPI0025764D3D|nr:MULTISPECIES: glycosyltransferase family 4 protein [unclassified Variovorax]MDM0090585.1 glycosyltransferase family 4 protein [Variovorax sp. J22G40]MDM0147750.1 glycosyltransferase family 4 protein [Variovorax sp. J2P1-31]